MKKSATAGTHFNARVVECRLAAKVLLINAVLQIRKKRRLSSLAHTTFSRQGITSGTFFLRKGKEERRSSTLGETLLAVSEKLV